MLSLWGITMILKECLAGINVGLQMVSVDTVFVNNSNRANSRLKGTLSPDRYWILFEDL
jgi:hypothetical protein